MSNIFSQGGKKFSWVDFALPAPPWLRASPPYVILYDETKVVVRLQLPPDRTRH